MEPDGSLPRSTQRPASLYRGQLNPFQKLIPILYISGSQPRVTEDILGGT
jgi:hypothetical protein